MGAYDEAHWQTAVGEIKPGIGVLRRGTVLCAGSGLTLASWCLPLPANVRRFARCRGGYHRSLFRWLGHRLCCSRRFIPRPRTHRQCGHQCQPRLRIRCAKTASLSKTRSPCTRREAKGQFHRRRAATGKPARRCPIRWCLSSLASGRSMENGNGNVSSVAEKVATESCARA